MTGLSANEEKCTKYYHREIELEKNSELLFWQSDIVMMTISHKRINLVGESSSRVNKKKRTIDDRKFIGLSDRLISQ